MGAKNLGRASGRNPAEGKISQNSITVVVSVNPENLHFCLQVGSQEGGEKKGTDREKRTKKARFFVVMWLTIHLFFIYMLLIKH